MFDYDGLRQLAKETGVPTRDLIVLSPKNDPFYAGVSARRERAEWFANLWQGYGFPAGSHLRRIHYVLISQKAPILWPNGEPYENTQNDWQGLVNASLGARYLGIIPDAVLVDRRNPTPVINSDFTLGEPFPRISPTYDPTYQHTDIIIPAHFSPPQLILHGFQREQDSLVEVWCEKSTMNDILEPLCQRFGVNLVTGIGEMSETATRLAVERQIDSQKPMRILYVSDFDPAGRSMPVAVARKIEHRLYAADIDADITLDPIVLTPDQCADYQLPRTPLKETERRAAKFEDRFGAGATELDALEALHPGELATIVEAEITRYIDPTLNSRVWAAECEVDEQIDEVEEAVREKFADEIEAVQQLYSGLASSAEDVEEKADDLRAKMQDEMIDAQPDIAADMVPVPRDPDPVDDPLFDSSRDYFEQIDFYKDWQGK